MSYESVEDIFYRLINLADRDYIILLEKLVYSNCKYCHICKLSLVCEKCRTENIYLPHSKVCERCGLSVHDDEHCYDFEAQVCSKCSVI